MSHFFILNFHITKVKSTKFHIPTSLGGKVQVCISHGISKPKSTVKFCFRLLFRTVNFVPSIFGSKVIQLFEFGACQFCKDQ